MKKLLLWTLILGVIGVGSYKGAAWYYTNRLLLEVKKLIELHAAIQHEWISTDFSGNAVIHGVKVTPYQLRKPLYADRVVIRFGSPLNLIKSINFLNEEQKGHLPLQLEVEWQQMNLPLSSNWEAYLPDERLQQDMFGFACGDIKSIGVSELEEMGYVNVPLSLRFSYGYDRISQELSGSFTSILDGMAKYEGDFEVVIPDGVTWPIPEGQSIPIPTIKKLRYTFEDKSFIRRATLLCGKKAGYNQDEFVQATIEKTQGIMDKAGIIVSEPLTNAYTTLLKGDSVIELEIAPAKPLNPADLVFMSADEVAATINSSVKVNRVPIPEASFTLNTEKFLNYLYPPPVVEKPTPPPKSAPKARYQLVPIELANQFIDSKIKVEQRSGKLTEGKLTNVEKFRIDVSAKVASGDVEYHFAPYDVSKLWIWSTRDLSRLSVPKPEPKPKEVDETKAPAGSVVVSEEVIETEVDGQTETVEVIVEETPGQVYTPTINDLPLPSNSEAKEDN